MRVVVGVVLLAGACSDGESMGPGPADAPVVVDAARCSVEPGRSWVVDHVRLLPPMQGFDLTGDGVPDNALGGLPQGHLDALHAGLDQEIAAGTILMILHLSDWTEPPTPTDEDISLGVYVGVDADLDATNNFSGDAELLVSSASFDLSCQSRVTVDSAVLQDRVVTAQNTAWSFPFPGTGTIEFREAHIRFAIAPDYATGSGELSGAFTMCGLSNAPFPGGSGTILDLLANDPALADVVPDLDLDGDGLETVTGDGVSILSCRDGDGTVIPGASCACEPAIADALSLGLTATAVGARIVGVSDRPL